MSDAETLYENLVRQIESDCAKKNYLGSLDICKAVGMQGSQRPHGAMGEHYVFELAFPNGEKVIFEFKWYDRSKTFAIRPDIHKFHVEYHPKDGKPLTHSNAYEG